MHSSFCWTMPAACRCSCHCRDRLFFSRLPKYRSRSPTIKPREDLALAAGLVRYPERFVWRVFSRLVRPAPRSPRSPSSGTRAPLTSLFAGNGPETTLTSGGSLAQFLPGQSNSTILNVGNPSVDQYLSFAGMVVPSNDFFMGNATPLQIFNSSGTFAGPITIQVYGSDIWDSDTEVQSITTGAYIHPGANPRQRHADYERFDHAIPHRSRRSQLLTKHHGADDGRGLRHYSRVWR